MGNGGSLTFNITCQNALRGEIIYIYSTAHNSIGRVMQFSAHFSSHTTMHAHTDCFTDVLVQPEFEGAVFVVVALFIYYLHANLSIGSFFWLSEMPISVAPVARCLSQGHSHKFLRNSTVLCLGVRGKRVMSSRPFRTTHFQENF